MYMADDIADHQEPAAYRSGLKYQTMVLFPELGRSLTLTPPLRGERELGAARERRHGPCSRRDRVSIGLAMSVKTTAVSEAPLPGGERGWGEGR